MVHENTLSCVNKAKDLVKSDSIDSLRYAALQLRMAIEYLFYELIPLYQEELPDDIASSKWQPREILDAILECDPDADKDSIIAFSPSDQTENERRFDTVLERKAPNKKMLRDYYHRLGAYAHAPVDLAEPDVEKWRSFLNKCILKLSEYSEEQALFNIRPLFEMQCECNRIIKRNEDGVRKTGIIACPNPNCRAVYDIVAEDDKWKLSLQHRIFTCPTCSTQQFVPAHKVKEKETIICTQCSARFTTMWDYMLVDINDKKGSHRTPIPCYRKGQLHS